MCILACLAHYVLINVSDLSSPLIKHCLSLKLSFCLAVWTAAALRSCVFLILTPSAGCLWVCLLVGWVEVSLPLALLLSLSHSPLSSLPHLLDSDQNTTATPLKGMTVPHPDRHTPPTFTHCPLPPFSLLLHAPSPPTPQTTSRLTTPRLSVQTHTF